MFCNFELALVDGHFDDWIVSIFDGPLGPKPISQKLYLSPYFKTGLLLATKVYNNNVPLKFRETVLLTARIKNKTLKIFTTVERDQPDKSRHTGHIGVYIFQFGNQIIRVESNINAVSVLTSFVKICSTAYPDSLAIYTRYHYTLAKCQLEKDSLRAFEKLGVITTSTERDFFSTFISEKTKNFPKQPKTSSFRALDPAVLDVDSKILPTNEKIIKAYLDTLVKNWHTIGYVSVGQGHVR